MNIMESQAKENITDPEYNLQQTNQDQDSRLISNSNTLNEDISTSTQYISVEADNTLNSKEESHNIPSSSSAKESNFSSALDKSNFIYQIKWISQNGVKSAVITQNENGPCPLIAIANVLIMKGRITLPSLVDIVTTEKLMEYLGDCILDSIPKNIPEGTQLNYEQNIHDAMAVLPKLQTGLDVNVKFTGISDFEYTSECVIFDLLRIPLYHGWLIDPQMYDVIAAIATCSYNQLVEKIVNSKSSSNPDKVTEALIAESFLEKTASQLTYHGLCELTSHLKEEELCVLFRNNHFISLIKHKSNLYQLVTDQGFLNENVVWETLNNIEGDSQFVDSNFKLVPPKPSNDIPLPPLVSEERQIDQDFLVALSLQEEQQKQESSELEWEDFKKKKLGLSNGFTDEELAYRLQEQEVQEYDNHAQPPQQEQQQVPTTRNRNRDCVIL